MPSSLGHNGIEFLIQLLLHGLANGFQNDVCLLGEQFIQASCQAFLRTCRIRLLGRSESQELENKIRQRAYELYEARGREDGHDLEDWLRAEEEITAKTARGVAA